MNLRRVRSEVPDLEKQRLYRNAVLVAIGGNALLAAAKGVVAWTTGSSAIFSDAANSLSDTLYSLLMGIGLYLAQRPADESHPQGHGRFEPLVSLFISAAMAAAGITAIWQAAERFMGQPRSFETGWPTVALVGSGLVKLGMFLLVRRLGERAHSPAIQATARDNLADILTSTAALIGVWGSQLIHPFLDPVAGLAVGLWIFRATWEILHENLGYLTGRGADPQLSQKIAEIARHVEGVVDVHRVVADYVGPRLRVDMHIDVEGSVTLEKAHEIGEQVQAQVEGLQDVDLAFVHVEPTGRREKRALSSREE
jgi:cation diffusion facilitator family transporter